MGFLVIILLAVLVFIIIVGICITFFVALIISIINLIFGIKRNWPKRNIVLLSIFGTIATILGIILFLFFARSIANWHTYGETEPYQESIEAMILYLNAYLR